ncbi:hypothetical protein Aperf_G00000095245 [Anoplocephala perfoliata]
MWKVEDLVAKNVEERAEGAPQNVTYICEEIPRSEAQEILSRSSSPELFIEDKVETKSESPKYLDDEQYLELIRQRIIQRILEVIELNEKKTQLPRSTLRSKADQLWKLSKVKISQLRSQLPSARRVGQQLRRWIETVVRSAESVIGTEAPNEEAIELKENEVAEDNRVEVTAKRESKKLSIGGGDRQADEGRKRFIIRGKQPSQSEIVLLDSRRERMPSLGEQLASLGTFSRKSSTNILQGKQSEVPVPIKKTKLFESVEASDEGKNLRLQKSDHEAEDRGIEQKRQKRKIIKAPKLKLKPLLFTSDTLDQISSSEFDPESDFNEGHDDVTNTKTLTSKTLSPQIPLGQPLPEVCAIVPNMDEGQTDAPMVMKKSVIPEINLNQVKGMDLIRPILPQLPSQNVSEGTSKDAVLIKESSTQKRHSSIFDRNEPRRISRIITGPKLPTNPEEKPSDIENPVPISVPSNNDRIRMKTSLEEIPSSRRESQKNADERETAVIDSPKAPPTPLRVTPSPNMHDAPLIVEVSNEERALLRERSNEDAHEAPSERKNLKSL